VARGTAGEELPNESGDQDAATQDERSCARAQVRVTDATTSRHHGHCRDQARSRYVHPTDCTDALRRLYETLKHGDVVELCGIRDLLLKTGKPGYIDMPCPWAHEHSGAVTHTSTSLRVSGTPDYKAEGLSCLHAHCSERTLADLRQWLGIPNRANAPAGSFDVTEIDLKTLTPRVWARVADTNTEKR